jgi:hypothetical protein
MVDSTALPSQPERRQLLQLQKPQTLSLAPLVELLSQTDAAGDLFPQDQDIQRLENASGWRTASCFTLNVTNEGARDAGAEKTRFCECEFLLIQTD